MADNCRPSNSYINQSSGTTWGWYGYFYFYFGGHKAGLSVSADGASR
jgi:hypothetical protein